MEVAQEIEDDLFFADLSRQISRLIMDDDEDPLANCPSVSLQVLETKKPSLLKHRVVEYKVVDNLQAFSRAIHPPVQSPFISEQTCRRESKGTGVFIPQSTQPRRRHRQGRFASYYAKPHRQTVTDNNTKMVSQLPSTGSFKPKFSQG